MRLAMATNGYGATSSGTDYVADIRERELGTTIEDWLRFVDKDPELTCIPLTFEDRTGHLPVLLCEVIARLRLDNSTKAAVSVAAGHHGILRRKQGYTVAMLVDESRMLQVCIFSTLHRNQKHFEFKNLLPDIAVIAD